MEVVCSDLPERAQLFKTYTLSTVNHYYYAPAAILNPIIKYTVISVGKLINLLLLCESNPPIKYT